MPQSTVKVRIDASTKEKARAILAEKGLSFSQAIRILLTRLAKDKRFPFETKIPNYKTRAAIAELESGKGERVQKINK